MNTLLRRYGDVTIETESGRMFAALHILISVAVSCGFHEHVIRCSNSIPRYLLTSNTAHATQNLGELFATIDELNTNRAAVLERVERLNHRLDVNLLDKINATAHKVARSYPSPTCPAHSTC